MLRDEIWLIDFEPPVGAEVNKRRPAVIVSNNAANAVAERPPTVQSRSFR